MGLLDRLFGGVAASTSPELTQGARDFLDGRKDTLTAADVDPDGAQKYAGYVQAMVLKKNGELAEAAEILKRSCDPPSIYKGHYRELFKIWRQLNRDDLKTSRHQEVVDRVLTMIRLDDEMIREMNRHWSIQQNRKLPPDYFDKDRNLRVSDAKALQKAAHALGQEDNHRIAAELVQRFTEARTN